MRWTQYLIPTTKETPKDAIAASHILMLRAGLIRQVAAGVYSYLPLGYRALRKVERIVREEMNRAGAIELHMSVLMPLSWWEETGRAPAYGDVLLRLQGRANDPSDYRPNTVLGPTHEEQITEIARAYLNSYKQLPINLYQIQTKFRGEARPKSGVLRTREFLMKDAYSFHADLGSLNDGYQAMYDAYCRIFARCGLPYLAVEAESGPIGGDASHEFMVLTDAGEDIVAVSENGDYAANTERATCAAPPAAAFEGMRSPDTEGYRAAARELLGTSDVPLREVHTPGAGRVEDVCKMLGTTPAQMIKTLIYTAQTPGLKADLVVDGRLVRAGPRVQRVVALVRGDHEVNEHKLRKVVTARLPDAVLSLAAPEVIEDLTGASVGFAGPHGLAKRLGPGDLLIIDRDVLVMPSAVSGANRTDYHTSGIVPGRDFPTSGENVLSADVRSVVAGDLSPTGSDSPLKLRSAMEIGHVFKLGTKYSDAMGAKFLTREGKPQSLIMGCYGIGLNRIIAAAIEARNDEHGIIWPLSIAPFEALVILLDPKDKQATSTAAKIYGDLLDAGVDALFDDRDERAGFKFKDADLIGIPLRIVVGKKSLAEGHVEFTQRETPGEKQMLAPQAAVEMVRGLTAEKR